MSSDLLECARQIVDKNSEYNRVFKGNAEEHSTIYQLAANYLANHIDDPDAPADLDWLEYRGWRIFPKLTIDLKPGAFYPIASLGPLSRRINVDSDGCSITSVKLNNVDVQRYLAGGYTPEQFHQVIQNQKVFSLPVTKGWPTRKQIVALENLAKVL